MKTGADMPTQDFHGKSVEEAINIVEKIIDDARSCRATYNCIFITGNGVIKKRLIELLKGYGFHVFEQIGNSGVLRVEVE